MQTQTHTINLPLLFTIGEIVLVDTKNRGYIIDIRGESFDLFFKIKYIIDNTIETNVSQHRCTVISINENNTSSRSVRVQRHWDVLSINNQQQQPTTRQTHCSPFNILQDTVIQTKEWLASGDELKNHPFLKYLKKNAKKEEWWLRNIFPLKESTEKKKNSTAKHKTLMAGPNFNRSFLIRNLCE